MRHALRRFSIKFLTAISLLLISTVSTLLINTPGVYATTLYVSNRTDELSTSTVSATATHIISFAMTDTTDPLGSIRLEFCSNDPIPEDSCVAPAGLNLLGASLASQSGNTGFVIATATANEILLSRSSDQVPNSSLNSYQIINAINPSYLGTFYLRLYTYSSIDGSGTQTEEGGIALSTNTGVNVTAQVPPYLGFCAGATITGHDCSSVSGYYLNFGDFSSLKPSVATSQFSVGTNAGNGYNVTINGSTLTSGNNVIPALANPSPSIAGTSEFGINLVANTSPLSGSNPVGPSDVDGRVMPPYNVPNEFLFNTGGVVVSSITSSNYQIFTTTYLANVSNSQAAGVYTSTITYVCLANF